MIEKMNKRYYFYSQIQGLVVQSTSPKPRATEPSKKSSVLAFFAPLADCALIAVMSSETRFRNLLRSDPFPTLPSSPELPSSTSASSFAHSTTK